MQARRADQVEEFVCVGEVNNAVPLASTSGRSPQLLAKRLLLMS